MDWVDWVDWVDEPVLQLRSKGRLETKGAAQTHAGPIRPAKSRGPKKIRSRRKYENFIQMNPSKKVRKISTGPSLGKEKGRRMKCAKLSDPDIQCLR